MQDPFTVMDLVAKVISEAGSSIVGAVLGGGPDTTPSTEISPVSVCAYDGSAKRVVPSRKRRLSSIILTNRRIVAL